MSTVTASFSAASIAAPQAASARAGAPPFSFDAAVAGLKQKSARALDIHGGAPRPDIGARPSAPAADAAAEQKAPAPAAADSAAANNPAAAQSDAPPPARNPSTPSKALAAPSPAAATPAPGVTIAPAPPLSSPSITGAPALSDGAARLKTAALKPAAPPRAPAAAVKQFAAILAQRLDNASQFDLRLDPPALGTIEGRLTLGDDGEARLALSFDNQSAFDLFRRDDAALRLALADAGFDLGGRNLQFSFREAPRERAHGEARPSSTPAETASLHRGAVDIRA
jgi:hypothetical protein